MNEIIQYYVEGECEKKLLQVLKTDLQIIHPGKIQVFNVANKLIKKTRLITLKEGTVIVLVFDTDTVNLEILQKNIKTISKMPNVKDVITVLQVNNLEDELTRCCNIRSAGDLLGVKGNNDFKNRFIKTTNLASILKSYNFDIKKIWTKNDPKLVSIVNNGKMIKKKS